MNDDAPHIHVARAAAQHFENDQLQSVIVRNRIVEELWNERNRERDR